MSLRDDLIREEGLRLKPYKDTLGVLTIGVGRNLEHVGITEAEAMALLDNDIARVYADLDRELSWWRGRPDEVKDALANATFQLGINGIMGFKRMLAALHAGDYETAATEAIDSKWYQQTPTRVERFAKVLRDAGKLPTQTV